MTLGTLYRVLCHRYQYYVLNDPSAPDSYYDKLEVTLPGWLMEYIGERRLS